MPIFSVSRPPLAVVVLAAGQGTRMVSDIPKPLHRIGGAPLLHHAMRAGLSLDPELFVVVTGHGAPRVAAAAREVVPTVQIVEQAERLGTGHAVRTALPALEDFEGDVLVLFADTPLIRTESLVRLIAARHRGGAIALLGFEADVGSRYGRILLDASGEVERIVEHADATEAERLIPLCNSGVMVFAARSARRWLRALGNDNAKGEYYLTELPRLARAEGLSTLVERCAEEETLGVNSRAELAAAEAAFQARSRSAAMAAGVTLVAPETVYFAFDTMLGRDVEIGPDVVFGPGVRVEDGAWIGSFSCLENCVVRKDARVGPFARLRPGADIGAGAHVGNFVEIKNASLGAGAKASHLAYLGDAEIGPRANIGAGTITCNYDGMDKHRTEIGAGAFIGSNSALVAPVRVGAGAYVGSGSVIVQDVPDDALGLGRAAQANKPGGAARIRARRIAGKASRSA